MIDLNNPKELKSAKLVTKYQEWKKYKEYVDTIFSQYMDIDKLEGEIDLKVAQKLKKIKDSILFDNVE